MKKILYLLLLFTTWFANAQIVNIPDANFKAALVSQGVDANTDGDIQVSEALAQTNLSVPNSNISDLTGIEAFTNLIILNCRSNQLTSIDVSQLTNLQELSCFDNQLTDLDVTQNVNLNLLYFSDNFITTIDLTQNINLNNLYCTDNLLTSLDVTQNVNLFELIIWNNQLTSIDISQNIVLTEFQCYNNQLTNLDISQNLNLIFLYCYDNQLTTLDASLNTNLNRIACQNNDLSTLFIKNGVLETELFFNGNPNLTFICADDEQVASVQSQAELTTVVSSYCSFTPGGDYNTITGTIIYDLNEDGCDAIDMTQPHIKIDINDGTEQGSTYTENSGTYNFYTQAGTFDITPNLENPTWFNVTPITANIPFADTDNNVTFQDFCITPVGIHNDIEIYIAPIDFARPGFDALYQIVYKNKGNQTMSGNFEMTFDDDVLDFVFATMTPDVQTVGNLSWDYVNLLPFENRSVYVTLNVNSPTETPAVNIGDQLNFNVLINPISGDEVSSNNSFEYNQIVVGSYDPNNITCLEGDILPTTQIGDDLSYIVNFENIGTFAAQNVVIEIDIDPTKYDINTLHVLNSSDPVSTRVKEDEVKFIFEDINLSASGGHGNILLRIKTKNTIQPGDPVTKKANIHFDYNFPIETNEANTVFENLSVDDTEIDNSITMYPNPVKNDLHISANTIIKSIEIYDVQGRIIQMRMLQDTSVIVQMSNVTNGIYFIKIKTEKGAKVEKLIKD